MGQTQLGLSSVAQPAELRKVIRMIFEEFLGGHVEPEGVHVVRRAVGTRSPVGRQGAPPKWPFSLLRAAKTRETSPRELSR